MDYTILCNELQNSIYTDLSDQDAANVLNALIVQAVRRVPLSELTSMAYSLGLVTRLRYALRITETPPDLAAVCESLLDLLKAPFEAIDVYRIDGAPDPATAMMLDVLQQAGLLSVDERLAIENLGWQVVSRATQLGLETVGDGHVRSAREMIDGSA